MKGAPPGPKYFATPQAFRSWLERHAAGEAELVVGFHKRATGVPCMTWPQAVDEALCFGWIDGVRKRIDEQRYQIRFTPRKASSTWSAINIERVRVLAGQGRMAPAGLEAFARRSEKKSRIYAYEQATAAAFDAKHEAVIRKNKLAWAFLQAQPAGYRQRVTWWVTGGKQLATRESRLARLIAACEKGERL